MLRFFNLSLLLLTSGSIVSLTLVFSPKFYSELYLKPMVVHSFGLATIYGNTKGSVESVCGFFQFLL